MSDVVECLKKLAQKKIHPAREYSLYPIFLIFKREKIGGGGTSKNARPSNNTESN